MRQASIVHALCADRSVENGPLYQVRAIPSVHTTCNWCDRRAAYEISESGWTDHACQEHRERYWDTGVSLFKSYAPTGPVHEHTLTVRLWRQELYRDLVRNDLDALAYDFARQVNHNLLSVVADASNYRV